MTSHPSAALSAVDASFLRRESPTSQMGNCGLAIVDCDTRSRPLGFDEVANVIEQRLPGLPRLRQRVAWPGGAHRRPVWVDDPSFDLTDHLRRVVLPAPGDHRQVVETVEQVHWRLLDRSRPLWELYVIEGLERNRLAVLMRFHHALADGMSAMYLAGSLLDDEYARRAARVELLPKPDGPPEAVGGAASNGDRAEAPATASWSRRLAAWQRALQSLPSPATFADGPFNRPVGVHRRVAFALVHARDLQPVRRALRCSTNDVVFSLVAGALRRLLAARGVPFPARLRVLVPLSELAATQRGDMGNVGSCVIVDLPVGPMSETARLRLVSSRLARVRDAGQRIIPSALGTLWESLPAVVDPLLVAVGERQRVYVNLVASYMRGSRRRLHFAGAAHEVTYPVPPLSSNLALTVAAVQLGGAIGFGCTGDWDAVPDIDGIAGGIHDTHAALRREVGA